MAEAGCVIVALGALSTMPSRSAKACPVNAWTNSSAAKFWPSCNQRPWNFISRRPPTCVKNASACISTGSNNSNGPAMRPSVPRGNTRPWNRRTGWWHGNSNGAGTKRCNEQRRLEEDYERFRHAQPAEVSPAEQQHIRSLASSIPVLWAADSTTAADRQRIIRFLIERIVVDVHGASERVAVTIHWVGGSSSSHELVRAVQRYDQMADYAKLCARIQELRAQGASMASVARHLNDEGFRPPKRAERFNIGIVAGFLAKGGRSGPRPRVLNADGLLQKEEWLLSDLARQLHMPTATMHRWRRVGWVHSRKLPVPGGHWAIWADRTELKRLARLRQFRRSWLVKSPPLDLTTPKPRDDK